MESPAPVLEKIDFKYNYTIEDQNIKYIVKIGKIEDKEKSLIFYGSEEGIMSSQYYQKSFNLNQLQEINKFFRACDSLEEAEEFIKEVFQEKSVLVKNEQDNLILILKFKIGPKKEEEVKIKLTKQSISEENIIQNLVNEVNDLKKAINLLIKENKK